MHLKKLKSLLFCSNTKGKATAILLIFQAIFILLFALFVDYGEDVGASHHRNNSSSDDEGNQLDRFYPSE